MKKPLAIDLFCGAGGMSEGIIQAGFHIVFSSDKSEEAGRTYQNRHEQLGLNQGINTYFQNMDIKDLTGDYILEKINSLEIFKNKKIKEIDAIFGGPPCQGFSRAGLRKENDPRNFLFREYLRVVNDIKPNYVVMENVVGLLDSKLEDFKSYDNEGYDGAKKVTDILEKEFKKIGYKIKNYGLKKDGSIDFKKLVLDASDFGVPQKRQRVILIAYRDKEPISIEKFKKKTKVTIKEALGDLILDEKIKQKYLEELEKEGKLNYILESRKGRTIKNKSEIDIMKNEEIKNRELSIHSKYIIERFSLFKNGESAKKVKDRLCFSEKIEYKNIPHLLEHSFTLLKKKKHFNEIEKYKTALMNFSNLNMTLKKDIIEALLSKKNMRVKLDKNNCSRTVVTLPDDYISPFEDRMFSVREMARLQSFDDSFEFLGKRTTGGDRRKMEVPQYTQVGNAVPPLLAKAIAKSIIETIREKD